MYHDGNGDYATAERGARQHLQQRLAKRIATGRDRARPILERIERDGAGLEDLIVPLGQRTGVAAFDCADDTSPVTMRIRNGVDRRLGLHSNATRQLAEKLSLPGSWLCKQVNGEPWQRQLAARILQEHAGHTPRDRVLVRTIDNQARGILSTSYRRLDSSLICGRFMEAAQECGAAVYNAAADDTRFWVEVALPQVFEIHTPHNGVEFLSAGVIYSTSDFGDGADQVRGWIERVWCTNRVIARSELR